MVKNCEEKNNDMLALSVHFLCFKFTRQLKPSLFRNQFSRMFGASLVYVDILSREAPPLDMYLFFSLIHHQQLIKMPNSSFDF